ncbi:MAG: YDG domain-containing protein, partial [Sulfuritalea sp.]|nr:YDG domain-containing protein [Sulfuritalea sp.]
VTIIGLTNPMAINNNGGSINAQTGTINLNGAVSFSGASSIGGNVTVSGGGGNNSGTLTLNAGAVLDYTGGSHAFTGATTFGGAGTLTLSGATWTGAGTVSLDSGGLNWTGGTLGVGGAGGITVATGRTLAISGGAAKFLDGGKLTNAGTTTFTDAGNLVLNNDALLTNNALFDIQSDSDFQFTAGVAPSLANTGTLRKSGGALDTVIGLTNPFAFTNSGILDVQLGTLNAQTSSFSHTGTMNLAAGATFQRTGGFTNAGIIQGQGTVNVGAGSTLSNAGGTLRPAGVGAAGTLAVTGNLNLAGGIIEIDLGGTAAGLSDKLSVIGNVTLGGTLNASLTGGYVPVNADFIPIVTMTGTASGTFASAILPPNMDAGYNLAAGEASRLIFSTVGTKTFLNTASDLNWATPANWSGGAVPGSGNTALISSGFAVAHPTGNDTIAALTVNSGNSLDVSGGSLTVTGATAVGGSLAVSGGTLVLNGASSVQTLGMTGGALNGSGNLTVVNGFNYSSGSVGLSGALDVSHTGNLLLPALGSLTSLLASATGNLTLTGGIAASATGNAIVLAAGQNFVDSGNHPLTASNGRWLVYSQSPATIAKGGLTSAFRHYGSTLGSYAPGSVSESGNGFIYASAAGTLSVTATATGTPSHVYGDAPSASFGYTLTGFADAEDNAGNIGIAGSPVFNVPIPTAASDAGSYSVSYVSNLSSSVGYTFGAGTGLAYSVSQAPLTITANNQGKVYGDVLSFAGTEFLASGLKNSQTVGDVTLASGGAAAIANVGGSPYAISASAAKGGSFNSANYSITYVDGALAVTARPLTVSFTAPTKTYDGNPAASVGAFVLNNVANGDSLGLLGTATAAYDSRHVGAAKTVSYNALGLSGGAAANYSLPPSANGTGAITQLASVAWTGGTSGIWSNAANWAGGALPDNDNVAQVIIPAGSSVLVTDNQALNLGNTAIEVLGSNFELDVTGGIRSGSGKIRALAGSISLIAHSPIVIGSGGVETSGGITLSALTPSVDSTITLNGALVAGGAVSLAAYGAIAQNAAIQGQNIALTSTSGNIVAAAGAVSSVAAGGTINYSATSGSITSSPGNFAGAAPILNEQASTSTTTSTTAITDITNAISKATEAPADEKVKTPETPPPAPTESTGDKILLASISQTTGGEAGTFGDAAEPTVGAGDTAITRTTDAAPAGEKTPANAEEKKEASKDKEKEEKKERPARDEKKQEGRAAAKKVAQCS